MGQPLRSTIHARPERPTPGMGKIGLGANPMPKRIAHADVHERVRRAHSEEIAEDYVEAIAELIEHTGRARVVDLADRFGVSHVTVVRTVQRLSDAGLVRTEPYRPVTLTRKGRAMADASRRRHDVVVRFLRAIGLDERTAQMDAEGIEHHVSPKTLARFEQIADAGRL
jgi:DtxR family manganese transport transcriptional regulator